MKFCLHIQPATGTYKDWSTPCKSKKNKFELQKNFIIKFKLPGGSKYPDASLRKIQKSENLSLRTEKI